jgi:regulatory protein
MSDIGSRLEIVSLWRMSDGRISVKVVAENNSGKETVEFILIERLYADLALEKGEIDCDTLENIEHFAEVSEAYRSACASFAYAPSSVRGLKRKLFAKGFSKDTCDEALNIMIGEGFINEDEIAIRKAQIGAGKLWGRTKIFAKLREEGFSDIAIKEADAALDEFDFDDNCRLVIRKKYGSVPDDRREMEKMYAFLSRQGYSSAEIHKAVRMVRSEDRDSE